MTSAHPHDDAPLFAQYWLHSALNPTRAALLAQRIGQDAAQPHAPPRPRHAAAATPLPPTDSAPAACHARRASQRAFGSQPLTAQALSNLLLPLAAKPGGSTRHLPSGGGKYPILVYGALYAVARAPALHGQRVWYDPLAHGLTPLGPLPPWPELAAALGVDWPAWRWAPSTTRRCVLHSACRAAQRPHWPCWPTPWGRLRRQSRAD